MGPSFLFLRLFNESENEDEPSDLVLFAEETSCWMGDEGWVWVAGVVGVVEVVG